MKKLTLKEMKLSSVLCDNLDGWDGGGEGGPGGRGDVYV